MRIDIRSDVSDEIDEIQYGDYSSEHVELFEYGVQIMDSDRVIISVTGSDVRNLAKALIKAADLKGW